MSARFIAPKIGFTTKDVYQMWNDMGVIEKDKWGNWILTEAGRNLGGRLSGGNCPVPTFKIDTIVNAMCDFYNKTHQ